MKPVRLQFAWIALAAVLMPADALATVAPPVAIRWIGPPPTSPRPGEELRGRFEITTSAPGAVENVTIEGEGWSVRATELPPRMIMATGARRELTLTATPQGDLQPLVVRLTFNGIPVEEAFRFDAATLDRFKAPAPIVFRNGSPKLVKSTTPRTNDQQLRFRGRVRYSRGSTNPVDVNADGITIRIMDDDSPFSPDEMIWEGSTDPNGAFDVTGIWDDCDVLGCDDPDIYLVVVAENTVITVRGSNVATQPYAWHTPTYNNFTGNEIDFGDMFPAAGEHQAAHLFTNLVRGRRVASLDGGIDPPPVWAIWPATGSTRYNPAAQQIHIAPVREWNEVSASHELMHHIENSFAVLDPPNYMNGFCDTPTPGHCVWCRENDSDAWQEGLANWFGRLVAEGYPSAYNTTPWAAGPGNDDRYGEDGLKMCGADGTFHAGSDTEGYVMALLRDIEDFNTTPDDHDGGAVDCERDLMGFFDDEIFTVVRDDHPETVREFIDMYRLRYTEHDQDLWSTVRNVAPSIGFPVPPPVVTSPPPLPCRLFRAGDAVVLAIQANGAGLSYQWRRDGVAVSNGPGIGGATTPTLTLSPASTAMAGVYNCLVTSCDGTLSTLSVPERISVDAAAFAQPIISWGENAAGQIGDGSNQGPNRRPARYNNLTDVVAADGGRSFTIALRGNGTVMSWGTEGSGELGTGGSSYDVQYTPTPIAGLNQVIQICSGYYHSLALRRDGTVRGWGYNGYGILGDGTQNPAMTPIVATRLDGYCVRAIDCGDYHSAAIVDNGTVLTWGYNYYASLGRVTSGDWSVDPGPVVGLHDVVAISSGAMHGLALRSDGTVWSWGYNNNGQLGDGTTTNRFQAVQVVGLTGIRSIHAGGYTSYAVSNDGTAYAWGSAGQGMIGDGDQSVTQRWTPVVVANLANALRIESDAAPFSLALMPDGTVRAWGYNYSWITGGPSPTYQLTPVQVPGIAAAASIGTGWGTAHAFGSYTGVADVPGGADTDLPKLMAVRVSPNPSVANATIAFDLPLPGRVSLSVYDVAGRRIRSLLDDVREAGRHSTTWDGRGPGGGRMVGVFYVRLELNGATLTERVVRM